MVFNICASDNLLDKDKQSKIDKRIACEKNQFCDLLQRLLNNELSERHPLKIGKTTNAMMIAGASYLDVYIKQTTIENSIAQNDKPIGAHSEGHALSLNYYEVLHEDLLAPALIFKSIGNNSVVFISDKRDTYNNPILIAIALAREQRSILVNKVLTIYGRREFEQYFRLHTKDIIGYNIEKANNLLLASQVQFLRGRSIISFDNNLPYIKNVVNMNDLLNMEYKEIEKLFIEIKDDEYIDSILLQCPLKMFEK